jgi:hypothetical protein
MYIPTLNLLFGGFGREVILIRSKTDIINPADSAAQFRQARKGSKKDMVLINPAYRNIKEGE